MPLLVSPIDGTTPMQQIRRDGIEIDRCPVSGGVWLDKGELEKLLQAVQEAVMEDRQAYGAYRQSHPQPVHHAAHHGMHHGHKPGWKALFDDDYEDYYKKKHGSHSKLKKVMDLFD